MNSNNSSTNPLSIPHTIAAFVHTQSHTPHVLIVLGKLAGLLMRFTLVCVSSQTDYSIPTTVHHQATEEQLGQWYPAWNTPGGSEYLIKPPPLSTIGSWE